MIKHLIHRYRERILISRKNDPNGISDQYHVNTARVHYPCRGVVVTCKHGNFLAASLHLLNIKNCLFPAHVLSKKKRLPGIERRVSATAGKRLLSAVGYCLPSRF